MSAAALGQAIREAREAKGITVRALARGVGLSAPVMSDLEHGRCVAPPGSSCCLDAGHPCPSAPKLPEIAAALGIPLDELRGIETRAEQSIKDWVDKNPGIVALLRMTRRRPYNDGLRGPARPRAHAPSGPRKVRFA